MRRWTVLTFVGGLAALVAVPWACAQNSSGHPHENGAPVADQFVSTPGQMVSTPGQQVTGPGQRVIPPGQTVIAPFHSVTQQAERPAPVTQTRKHRVAPRRRHPRLHRYRPEYGAAERYAVPYLVDNGSGAEMPAANGAAHAADAAPRTTVRASSGQAGFGRETQSTSLAGAPSGNRPPYRGAGQETEAAPSTGPNVIQREEPVLTVVMKNGERRKMRNYALTPKVLMDLDEAASGKEVEIPLSRINVAATEKAAAQAGLNFAVPTS